MDRRMYRGTGRTQGRYLDTRCGEAADRYASEDPCERDDYEDDFSNYPIGMCYVPWQRFKNLYENEFAALANGTLFKDLDLDWYGRGCK